MPAQLRSKKKPLLLKPVRPNLGIQANYKRRLDALIDEMNASILFWIGAAYKANTPEIAALASDKSPAATLDGIMKRLARRWEKRFDRLAPSLARYFAKSVANRSDGALALMLKKSGFTVSFKMTSAQNDAMQATIAENVGLIKSIASKHLADIQGDVMRSVALGGDLKTLTDTLVAKGAQTRKRAAFIARDQNNKATAVINRTRQIELGITQAVWMHTGGGKKPRPAHVKAGRDKMMYDVTKGAYIDGEYIFPGQLPNCRCVSASVIPGLDASDY